MCQHLPFASAVQTCFLGVHVFSLSLGYSPPPFAPLYLSLFVDLSSLSAEAGSCLPPLGGTPSWLWGCVSVSVGVGVSVSVGVSVGVCGCV